MHQLEGYTDSTKPGHICKLNKAIYKLKQAPRAWYHNLKRHFIEMGLSKYQEWFVIVYS